MYNQTSNCFVGWYLLVKLMASQMIPVDTHVLSLPFLCGQMPREHPKLLIAVLTVGKTIQKSGV